MILDIVVILFLLVIFPALLIFLLIKGNCFISRAHMVRMKEHFHKLGITVTNCSLFRIKGELRGQRFEYHHTKESKEPLRAYLEIYHAVPLNLGLSCRDRSWKTMVAIFILSLLGVGKKVVLPYLEEQGLDCFAKNKEGALNLLGTEEVSANIQHLVKLLGQRALDETVCIDDKKVSISYYIEAYEWEDVWNFTTNLELPRKEGLDAMAAASISLSKGAGLEILRY